MHTLNRYEWGVAGQQSLDFEHVTNLRLFTLVINQLDEQKFILQQVYFMSLHVSSTMCSSSGGQNCIIQPLVSSHL